MSVRRPPFGVEMVRYTQHTAAGIVSTVEPRHKRRKHSSDRYSSICVREILCENAVLRASAYLKSRREDTSDDRNANRGQKRKEKKSRCSVLSLVLVVLLLCMNPM